MFEVNLRRAEGSVALTVESGCVRGNFILCPIFVKTSPKQFDGSSTGRFPKTDEKWMIDLVISLAVAKSK